MSGGRVFFYVQHLLGIGHTMRAAALTRAMQQADLQVTYVSGGFDTIETDLAGAEILQLPPVRAVDASFKSLVGADGAVIDDAWRDQRRAALLNAFDAARPGLVLIEMFPFGRWPFRFELLPLLDAARGRARVVCSLRDILVPKSEPSRLAAIVDTIGTYFDAILVHGDPAFIALDETFPRAGDISGKLHYTGYVAPEPPRAGTGPADGAAEVIVSAGGGGTGGAMMRTALAARDLSSLSGAPWRFLIGPNLSPEDRATLTPRPGVVIEPLRPDFTTLLGSAALSISQAGYNTVMDLLACGTRGILVPFSTHGQSEQSLRATRLADRGWADLLPEKDLTPVRLAAAIDAAMAKPPPRPGNLNLDGARRSAAFLSTLIDGSALPAAHNPHMSL